MLEASCVVAGVGRVAGELWHTKDRPKPRSCQEHDRQGGLSGGQEGIRGDGVIIGCHQGKQERSWEEVPVWGER